MPSNTAETPQAEDATKIGMSVEKPSAVVLPGFSVAPMMDWTDDQGIVLNVKDLDT
jgi:hypothetical protein